MGPETTAGKEDRTASNPEPGVRRKRAAGIKSWLVHTVGSSVAV